MPINALVRIADTAVASYPTTHGEIATQRPTTKLTHSGHSARITIAEIDARPSTAPLITAFALGMAADVKPKIQGAKIRIDASANSTTTIIVFCLAPASNVRREGLGNRDSKSDVRFGSGCGVDIGLAFVSALYAQRASWLEVPKSPNEPETPGALAIENERQWVQKQAFAAHQPMSATGQKRTSRYSITSSAWGE